MGTEPGLTAAARLVRQWHDGDTGAVTGFLASAGDDSTRELITGLLVLADRPAAGHPVTAGEFPEMLAAAGLAAAWCSTPGEWPRFIMWARDNGFLLPEENLPQEFMTAASREMSTVIRDIETELTWARILGGS
jgi:hypothetical protein